jgi:hypothetical protein
MEVSLKSAAGFVRLLSVSWAGRFGLHFYGTNSIHGAFVRAARPKV